ncbi:MAG: Beta-N-acetylhexosaminidase [Clostridia bacterium]|nr:Beta-N-acetylhexosaminidase [Clostridia bacterium]
MVNKRFILIMMILILSISLAAGCQKEKTQEPSDQVSPKPPLSQKDPIEEQIEQMTLDEKLGQMIIAGLTGYEAGEDTRQLIESFHVGGFILYSSNIESSQQLLKLTNSLKELNAGNKVPLFISVDEEGGRVSRIPKEIKNLPKNSEIGKINNKEFSYKVGKLLGEKVRAFGFNMDFAPVLDINSNPKNPVIGDRAFGADERVVSELGVQTMKGMQETGVIPVVKHFPGHGDTAVDSHIGLPFVYNDLKRLKSFELIPFAAAVEAGADMVMAAHIVLPEIDKENPATLSKTIITDILREQMNFDGVVITDDMTMGAISENYELGAAAVKSVEAGSDIIMVAYGYDNALTALTSMKEAVQQGLITEERIDQSVYRILKLKQKYNLKDEEAIQTDIEELNSRIEDVLDTYMK